MNRASIPSDPIFCFTHIQKAGGTTVEAVFRRSMGLRHMVVNPHIGWLYTESDMRADLRLNPFARNLCGHWLRPFPQFGRYEHRLVWYTMLRDPVSRYVSHYRYHRRSMGSTQSFESFLRRPIQQNLQTQLLAGEQDVDAAKQLLRSRYRCVGLLERFDESLLLMREALQIPSLTVAYGQPHNVDRTAKRGTSERLETRYRDDIIESNRHDIELYEYAVREIFPAQVSAYGEQRLAADLETEFLPVEPTRADRLREAANIGFRRLIYVPANRVRRGLAKARGLPDIRRY